MKTRIRIIGACMIWALGLCAQETGSQAKELAVHKVDTLGRSTFGAPGTIYTDTIPTITIRDVNIIRFKNAEEEILYYKYKSRIQKVLPYVKIAKQLYGEIKEEKENANRRSYRHYRKDLEKEMRDKFENELKDLTIGQGEMLFKLINRETKNNAYSLIKEIKNPFTAWFYQIVAKRWGYDLKENYDPEKERLIELIIRELGPGYNVPS